MERSEKHKLLNIFFATAVGIATGFILIKEYLAPMSPWLSLLGGAIGGLTAYILNDWRGALAAIPKAWKATLAQIPIAKDTIPKIVRFIFKTKVNGLLIIFSANVLFYCCFPLLVIGNYPILDKIEMFLLFYLWGLMLYSVVCALLEIGGPISSDADKRWADMLKSITFYSFPPILLAFCLYKIIRETVLCLSWFILGIPIVLGVVGLWLCLFFKFIHTSDRLICAVDAFIFAVLAYGVGVLSGDWLAGSVTVHLAVFSLGGGVFGVLNKLFIKQAVDSLAVWLQNKLSIRSA